MGLILRGCFWKKISFVNLNLFTPQTAMAKFRKTYSRRLDEFWKNILQVYFRPMIESRFPRLAKKVDWSVAPESLDKEMQNVVRYYVRNRKDRRGSVKIVDKLFRLKLKTGEDHILLFHTEAQSRIEPDFEKRVFIYYALIFLRLETEDITTLVIFPDEVPTKRPVFSKRTFGTNVRLEFNQIVVAEQDEAQLVASKNPFDLALLANYYILKAKRNDNKRLSFKKELYKLMNERGFLDREIENFFIFVTPLFDLPSNLEDLYDDFKKDFLIQSSKVEFMATLTAHEIIDNHWQGLAEKYVLSKDGLTYKEFSEQVGKLKKAQAEVQQKQAEVQQKQAEVQQKQAEVQQKQAEVQQKQAEAQQKQAEAQQKQAEAQQKQAEAQQKQAEAQQKQAEAQQKQAEVQQEKIELEQEKTQFEMEKQRILTSHTRIIHLLYFDQKFSVSRIAEETGLDESYIRKIVQENEG
jgi:predicted MPP superfamily phosphohydrolase